jgi:hypothetical protein
MKSGSSEMLAYLLAYRQPQHNAWEVTLFMRSQPQHATVQIQGPFVASPEEQM